MSCLFRIALVPDTGLRGHGRWKSHGAHVPMGLWRLTISIFTPVLRSPLPALNDFTDFLKEFVHL